MCENLVVESDLQSIKTTENFSKTRIKNVESSMTEWSKELVALNEMSDEQNHKCEYFDENVDMKKFKNLLTNTIKKAKRFSQSSIKNIDDYLELSYAFNELEGVYADRIVHLSKKIKNKIKKIGSLVNGNGLVL